jgi:hypothetical protein
MGSRRFASEKATRPFGRSSLAILFKLQHFLSRFKMMEDQKLARHSTDRPLRVHLHAHPGSWLNLIEGFFSKASRSVLRHIRVTSKQELRERIMTGIEDVS